jgi:hypothetical protein
MSGTGVVNRDKNRNPPLPVSQLPDSFARKEGQVAQVTRDIHDASLRYLHLFSYHVNIYVQYIDHAKGSISSQIDKYAPLWKKNSGCHLLEKK